MPFLTIPEAVRAKRLSQHFSQHDLAVVVDACYDLDWPVLKGHISSIERGLDVPPKIVTAVCDLLEVDLAERKPLEKLEDGIRQLNAQAVELQEKLALINKQKEALDMALRFLKGEP